MDWEFVRATTVLMGINVLYAVVALFAGVIAVRIVDRIMLKKIDLEEEIKKGNIAASIFGSVLILFVAIIIGLSITQ